MEKQLKLNDELVAIKKGTEVEKKHILDTGFTQESINKDVAEYNHWLRKRSLEKANRIAVSMMPTIPAYTMPIFHYEIDNCKELNQNITDLAYKLREEDSGGMVRSNYGGWHSDTMFHIHKEVYPLRVVLEQILENILQESKINKDEPTRPYNFSPDMWCNINNKGDMNTVHTHPGAHYSGTYYVKVPEGDAGDLQFVDTRCHQSFLKGNDIFNHTCRVIPAEGAIYIFRSDMHHLVYPNKTDKDRISIAFNFTLYDKV